MRERRYGAGTLVQADRKQGEDGRAIALRSAAKRIVHMVEARIHRQPMAWQQRMLGRTAGESFKGIKAMIVGEPADRVHSGVEVVWRQAPARASDLGHANTHLLADG
jgi:hypothetical protein